MLFGARIEAHGDGYRLVLQRQPAQQAAMIWAIMVAESQDFAFNFLTFHLDMPPRGLRGRTASSRFLTPAYRRWYPFGRLHMPADVELNEGALAFWVSGSWDLKGGPTRLPVAGVNLAGCLQLSTRIMALTHWPVIVNRAGEIVIPASVREVVETWLRQKGVPQRAYRVVPGATGATGATGEKRAKETAYDASF
jgi:hypothetical protein